MHACQHALLTCRLFLVQDAMRGTVRHYFGGGAAALNMHERLSEVLMLAVTSAMEDAGKLITPACWHCMI